MLHSITPSPNLAVKDLNAARSFYEETLGLTSFNDSMPGVVVYDAGSAKIIVYESEFAGTNKATAITWSVGDAFDKVVRDLESKGADFQHYDLPGITRTGNVHSAMGMKMVWLTDVDGNIISVMS